MNEVIQIYLTPAMVLAVGIFVGVTNQSIKDMRREFTEFKQRCEKINCGKKVRTKNVE